MSNAIFPYLMLFSAIFPPLFIRLWGQFYEPKRSPIDPTMDVDFVKHDLRNISAFVEDRIGADRPVLQ